MDSTARNTVSKGYGFEALKFFFVVLLVFLIYSNTLESPFVFDDQDNIQKNPHIRLTSLTWEETKKIGLFEDRSYHRPVATISFALNYYFHRYNLPGYHLVNILIHVATGIFLYLLVKATLGMLSRHSRHESHKWVPFFTMLVWLVHPIQTQSITYIVQRMNSMAAMFYVLSLLCYARARLSERKGKKRLLFAGCLLSGILSLGSKEISATLPFFIFLYEWYFFQDLSWPWLRRHILPLAGLIIILCLVAWFYLGGHPLEQIVLTFKNYDFTLSQRVLTEFRVVFFYLTLLIFPHPSRLNIDHYFSISHSLIDPITTLLSLGLIAGLIVFAIIMARKERLISFCILWFLGNLVIESSVIGLELLYEHRTYLPSMLVILLVVLSAHRYVRSKWLKIGMLCVVVTMFSFWTYDRNSIWGDELSFWRDCVGKSYQKARPNYNMGVALDKRGRLEEAITYFSKAIEIAPNYANAHYNLGVALMGRGRVEEAKNHFSKTLQIKPNFAMAHNNLGAALMGQGKLEEATTHLSEALQIKQDFAKAHYNLGLVLLRQKKHEEAVSHFSEALRLDPEDVRAQYDMGNALVGLKEFERAIGHYNKALQIKPDNAKVHYRSGIALMRQRRFEEAVYHFSKALLVKPEDARAHYEIGNALVGLKEFERAISHYTEALRIAPGKADFHNNLGVALANQGRIKEAVNHFSEAVRIKPEYESARRNLKQGLRFMNTPVKASNASIKP